MKISLKGRPAFGRGSIKTHSQLDFQFLVGPNRLLMLVSHPTSMYIHRFFWINFMQDSSNWGLRYRIYNPPGHSVSLTPYRTRAYLWISIASPLPAFNGPITAVCIMCLAPVPRVLWAPSMEWMKMNAMIYCARRA